MARPKPYFWFALLLVFLFLNAILALRARETRRGGFLPAAAVTLPFAR